MGNKEIFKVGDTVYHYVHGKGKVVNICENNPYPVLVNFDRDVASFTKEGKQFVGYPPTLSFTPYRFIREGFSQERPLPDIEVGTLVYVNDGNEWIMRYFAHFGNRGEVYCFRHQNKSNKTTLKDPYFEWSLTNPLEEK